MRQLHRYSLTLAILTGSWANPSLADPDPEALFGLSVTLDRSTICFTPEAASDYDDELPFRDLKDRAGCDPQWRISLGQPPIFEAQWTHEHYQGNLGRNDVLQAWENDFRTTLFPEGHPLEDMKRCGRKLGTPYSRYGIQAALCDADTLQLNFTSFLFSDRDENTPFAVKLYGAEWVCPWDDVPGLHRRSLPGDWVLRKKTSPAELNRIRFTSPESRVFAISIQGPGINSGDSSQYDSLLCLYYVPKLGQALSRIDHGRSLLREILLKKLRVLPSIHGAVYPPNLDVLLAALKLPPSPPSRRELRATFLEFKRICFSEHPIRDSWLYQREALFFEAVYLHAYTHFVTYGSSLLANLLWNERAKGEALRQKCSKYFNPDALPQELQDFLFNPNAPFAKLRFQVNIQPYMSGQKQIKGSDGKEHWVPDLIQCLRPHYAVANMPFSQGRGAADLVNGHFAMKLYGAHFTDQKNPVKTSPHLPHGCPPGFLLRNVHIHEGTDKINGVADHFWLASPNNCQIAGTDRHDIDQSFYSVVIGKCMQSCDDYRDRDARPWDEDVTAIVTLHILLDLPTVDLRTIMRNADLRTMMRDANLRATRRAARTTTRRDSWSDVVRAEYYINNQYQNCFAINKGESFSSVAQKLFLAYANSGKSQPKNPFEELCKLLPPIDD